MHIVIVHNSIIPVTTYGGIERVIWYLGEELVKMKHKVTFLVREGSSCPFAQIKKYIPGKSLNLQIPENADMLHIHFNPSEYVDFPHLITIHGNLPKETTFYPNTSFVSENHSARYNANAFVYNGLNWNDYATPEFLRERKYVHFLGKAAWRVKNVKGAIRIAGRNKIEIKILGGYRLNLKMGFRFTVSKYATFYGMIGADKKNEFLKHSKGLIFPVIWHEPFGLAIIESLYFGCPVVGTQYGALPELVIPGVGFLSNSFEELSNSIKELDSLNRNRCSEYATDIFNSRIMAENYIKLYERILNGKSINKEIPCFNESLNMVKPLDP